jgi:hypothetical protein
MNQKQKYILFILIIFCSQFSYSQVNETKKDTAKEHKKIETYSKRNKFTKFVYKHFFEPIKSKVKKVKPKRIKKKYYPFEGKIIRNINITTLDPFGYSEIDTTAFPKKFMSKAGNRIHNKTKEFAIRNLLLFRRNKPLDSLRIKESERIIRSQRYIRKVLITPKLTAVKSDSVDVYIRVLDSWSIIPEIAVSNTKLDFDLNERNFLGTGHQFENNYKNRFTDGKSAYSGKYSIPNILNTFVSTTVDYRYDLENNYGKIFKIDRPFFSPLAKWGAGVYFDQQFRSDSLPDLNLVYANQHFKLNTQDFWAGKATHIFKGNSINTRTTNLITSARYLKINYLESPTIDYDKLDVFSNENFYLVGIGISSRQYVEDKFIFNYQITEDVPVGKAFGITAGSQEKNNNHRLYVGLKASMGNYYKWGYLSSNFEYGTFFNNSKTEQNAFSVQANYFTNLFEIGDWKIRQFVKSQLIIGNKRLDSNFDRLTINEDNGISGFSAATLFGTKKLLFTLQTQSYSPWSLGGFRFNPYINYTMGMLGDAPNGFKKSKAYSQFGVGVIIRNDYLVFSSFQLSLAFYPVIPGSGDDIFKTNAINSEDFGFQDFEISKPESIKYK